MPRYMWSSEWETGEEAIDSQHRALFQQMEKLADALMNDQPAVGTERLLTQLNEHLGAHFQDEEERMAATGYPGLLRHRSLHGEMLERVKVLLAAFHKDPEGTPREVLNFLATWHLKHIAQEDKGFADYLKTQG